MHLMTQWASAMYQHTKVTDSPETPRRGQETLDSEEKTTDPETAATTVDLPEAPSHQAGIAPEEADPAISPMEVETTPLTARKIHIDRGKLKLN